MPFLYVQNPLIKQYNLICLNIRIDARIDFRIDSSNNSHILTARFRTLAYYTTKVEILQGFQVGLWADR